MVFTREDTKRIRVEMTEAINEVAKKYGAEASVGRISFGADLTARITLSKVVKNEYGNIAMDKNSRQLLLKLEAMGLREEVFNEPIEFKGNIIRLVGYSMAAKKYPILFLKDGKKMKCGVEFARTMVREQHPEYFL